MKTKFSLILFLLYAAVNFYGQTRTNMEKIFDAIDASVLKVDSSLAHDKSVPIVVSVAPSLEILKPKVVECFSNRGYKIFSDVNPNSRQTHFSLMSAKVDYADTEKDGLFGDVLVDRIVSTNCVASITSEKREISAVKINSTVRDTILLDEIKSVEDKTLSFTQSEVPPLPFISGLMEPVIVLGTLIITVILLFIVRGK